MKWGGTHAHIQFMLLWMAPLNGCVCVFCVRTQVSSNGTAAATDGQAVQTAGDTPDAQQPPPQQAPNAWQVIKGVLFRWGSAHGSVRWRNNQYTFKHQTIPSISEYDEMLWQLLRTVQICKMF